MMPKRLQALLLMLAVLSNIDSKRRYATAQADQPPIFINAGGPIFTDSTGNVWSADIHFNTGKPYKPRKVVPIANTTEDTLYQTERWDPPTGPELRYDIPLLNGDYDVYLHFAEVYWTKVGQRVFNVSVAGSVVIENLDILAEAGSKTALIKHIPATVTGGSLAIKLIHVTENPKINAIEVHAVASSGTQASAPSPTLISSSASPTVAQPSMKGEEAPSAPSSTSSMSQPSSVSFDPIYINAGGATSVTASSGRVFQADNYFNTGKTWKSKTFVEISGTLDDDIYQNERYDVSDGEELKYNIDVPNGEYEVTLHFAEIYDKVYFVGGRVFTVVLEGSPVFFEMDIFAEAGPAHALVKTATTKVTDKVLTIEFLHVTENPKINAIEVHAVASSGTQTSAPSPTLISSSASPAVAQPSMKGEEASSAPASTSSMSQPSSVSFDPIYINAGGVTSFTDSSKRVFEPDNYFNTGKTWKSKTFVEISGTSDDGMYQNERYDVSDGEELKYNIDVPNGEYKVTLHFAEIYDKVYFVGGRVFTVVLEGSPVFFEMDIFAEAGPAHALVKTATTNVTDKVLTIEFLHVTENPKINAIEVHAVASSGTQTSAPSPTLISSSASPAGAQPSMKGEEASSAPASTPSGEGSFPTIRINAGGGNYTDSKGALWLADAYFNTGKTYKITRSIGGTHDKTLYQTERYDDGKAPQFLYNIPVPDGNFLVTLHFADIYQGTHEIGGRVFDVLVEDFGLCRDLDIYSEVGGDTALIKSTPAAVRDGFLTIELISIVDSAKISAIEIEALGSVTAHQAHAVPGGPYFTTDTDGNNLEAITVDGTYSHTHGQGANLFSWKWIVGGVQVGEGEVATLELPVGVHNLTLEVVDTDGDVARDYTTVTVRPFGYPDIVSLSPNQGDFAGGDRIVITGSGFVVTAVDVVVRFGLEPLSGPDITVVDDNTIEVHVTPPRAPGTAMVTVETPLGVSNALSFTYINFSLPPVKFTLGTILPFIYGPTTIAFGPDGKLYVGTQTGDIMKITLNDQYQVVNTLLSSVVSTSEPSLRSIMGIAFDPMDTSPNPTVYVAHSTLFHGDIFGNNGKVSAVSGAALDSIEHKITGLPVSDHDHGINGMEFGDQGELYIQVGGNTNAGIPGYLSTSGLQKEGVLSAATLVAYLSRPEFDGHVTYHNQTQDQASGFDVKVFAAGQRNPFDIVLHSNGNLYATDNGPNIGFGRVSLNCTHDDIDPHEGDKLNLIVEGGYYGHPNRKRGETDPRQCVWRSATGASDANFTAPLKALQSSSNGITEFQSDHFAGQLRGHLIVGRYKGALFDIQLSSDGKSVLYNVETLQSTGGLDVTQGPTGALFVARHDKGQIIYYAPDEPTWTELRVKSVFPRRGPESGGSLFTLYGENFDSFGDGTPTVTVGGEDCPLNAPATFQKIICTLPAGAGTVDIVVTAGSETTTFKRGYRFIPGNETSIMP